MINYQEILQDMRNDLQIRNTQDEYEKQFQYLFCNSRYSNICFSEPRRNNILQIEWEIKSICENKQEEPMYPSTPYEKSKTYDTIIFQTLNRTYQFR